MKLRKSIKSIRSIKFIKQEEHKSGKAQKWKVESEKRKEKERRGSRS